MIATEGAAPAAEIPYFVEDQLEADMKRAVEEYVASRPRPMTVVLCDYLPRD